MRRWQCFIYSYPHSTLKPMRIQPFVVGALATNCYVVDCEKTREAIIIDPGFETSSEAEQIFRYVDSFGLNVKFIVNTHGHEDHVSGDSALKKKYCVPICIHSFDAFLISSLDAPSLPANVLLKDEQQLRFGETALRVMHTPGHSPGSVSLVGEKTVFTGDTLFAGGIGRTDFTGGSDTEIRVSLKKLLCLPDDYFVCPGHGFTSIIGTEKRVNPYL